MSVPTHLPHQQPSPIPYQRHRLCQFFIKDLNSSPLITNPPSSLPKLLKTLTQVLSLQTLPAACPTCSTHISQPFAHYLTITTLSSPKPINPLTLLPLPPWITTEILILKTARRCLVHTYIASHSIFDLKLLCSATNHYHKFISAAKKSFYSSLVHSSSSNPHAFWKTITKILHRTANHSLFTSSPLAALSHLLATYFSDKISKLHFNLQTNQDRKSVV